VKLKRFFQQGTTSSTNGDRDKEAVPTTTKKEAVQSTTKASVTTNPTAKEGEAVTTNPTTEVEYTYTSTPVRSQSKRGSKADSRYREEGTSLYAR